MTPTTMAAMKVPDAERELVVGLGGRAPVAPEGRELAAAEDRTAGPRRRPEATTTAVTLDAAAPVEPVVGAFTAPTLANRARQVVVGRPASGAGRCGRPVGLGAAAQLKTPLAMVEVAASAHRVKTLARTLWTPGSVGRGQGGQLGQMGGQPEGRRRRRRGGRSADSARARARSARTEAPPARAASSAARAASGAGFRVAGLPSHQPP